MRAPTIADRKPTARINGPLLARAKEALAAALQGDGASFSHFLVAKPDLRLSRWTDAETLEHGTFDVSLLRAVQQSCVGPWANDEGAYWVQLSWFCREDAASPLSPLVRLVHSPELSLTLWFKDGLIESATATEPFPVPGRSLLAKGAFCHALQQGTPFAYDRGDCPSP